MASDKNDIRLIELKDTISQLNQTIRLQTEMIKDLQKTIEEHYVSDEKKDQMISNLQAELSYLKTKFFWKFQWRESKRWLCIYLTWGLMKFIHKGCYWNFITFFFYVKFQYCFCKNGIKNIKNKKILIIFLQWHKIENNRRRMEEDYESNNC